MTQRALTFSRWGWVLAGLVVVILLADAPQAGAQAKTRIVYMHGDQIRSVRIDGRRNRRLAQLPGLVDIAASDNGRRIAAVSVGERTTPVGDTVLVARIWSMRGDGSKVTVVRDMADADVRSVALSHNGRRLWYQTGEQANFAFGRQRNLGSFSNYGWNALQNGDQDVWVGHDCVGGGGGYGEVAATAAEETDLAFTRNGFSYAFSSDAGGGELWTARGAYSNEDECGGDGKRPRRIARTGSGTHADPDFSPRGRRLVYVGRRRGRFRLMTIGIGGKNRQVLGNGIRGLAPQWTRLP